MADNITRDKERLPDSEAAPEYPFNKVYTSPSGHRTEIDDTPGKERIFEGHRSGTYREVSKDGKLVESVVGNKFEYTKGTAVITIDGFIDFKASGGKIVILGGTLAEIVGKLDIVVYGDANVIVAGKAKIVADEILLSSNKDINICAGKDVNIEAERDIVLKAKRNISTNSKGFSSVSETMDMDSTS